MKKKRNKPYIPREKKAPMIVGQQMVFAPITQFLHQIRHSEILEYRGESMIEHPAWSELYSAVPTLRLFANVFALWAAETGNTINVWPLRQLANHLVYEMPITESTLAPVERLFERMQMIGNTWTHAQTIGYLERAGLTETEAA